MPWAEGGADLQTRGSQPGCRSLWVPRLPDSIPAQSEPRETMGIVQWQENCPSRWTCAQDELSVPEASKEGSVGSLWGFGARVAACGLDPRRPVLPHLSALGLHPSSLCPHRWSALGLPTAPGPGAAPPPPSDPVPLRWSNCRSWVPLCHAALEVPFLSQDALGD